MSRPKYFRIFIYVYIQNGFVHIKLSYVHDGYPDTITPRNIQCQLTSQYFTKRPGHWLENTPLSAPMMTLRDQSLFAYNDNDTNH